MHGWEGGREGGRKRGREGGREGGRKGGREGGRKERRERERHRGRREGGAVSVSTLSESEVALVREGCVHQLRGVALVLVRVVELCIHHSEDTATW